ncbi:MAG: potassium channel family protein [Methanosarcina sp.]
MDKEQFNQERIELLQHIDDLLDFPLVLLSILWLVLIIIEFTYGLSSTLQMLTTIIWIIFILDFLIELSISPDKKKYLRTNWLVVLSLFLPAIRILRLFSAFRILKVTTFVRSLNLARVLSSFNRSIRTVKQIIKQRGLEYILLLTILITFIGAAGMYDFERPGLNSYWDALWWTAMIMTTIGSDYWPRTPEGRILTLMLSIYAFSIFGYITAAFASLLVGKDTKTSSNEISELRKEVQQLSVEINRLSEKENK